MRPTLPGIRKRLSTLLALLLVTLLARGTELPVRNETVSLSRYVYVGSIGRQQPIWLLIEPADEHAREDDPLLRPIVGRVSGSYHDLSTGEDEYLALKGEIRGDGHFVLEAFPQSFAFPSLGAGAPTGRFDGRFTAGFQGGKGKWMNADGGYQQPFRLQRVARYEQREVAYTLEEVCAGDQEGCARRLEGTDRCRYNTGYLSRYPVWEGAEYAALNETLSSAFWEEPEPLPEPVPFDPQAPYLESTYHEINVLSVFSDVVNYGFYAALNSCGAAHPANAYGLGSLVRDAHGRFEALPLDAAIATDPHCRAALRKVLSAAEDMDAEQAEDYDGFALTPTGFRFVYNLDHASGGRTVFVPYETMPAGCVLARKRGRAAE
jgi:hypothetical protein